MGIFDSIKNAFGNKAEEERDVTVSPSQMLRDAGLDPGGLKFGFGTGSITVSGEIADESARQKILEVLAKAPGITTVQDNLVVAAPVEPEAVPADDIVSAAPEVAEATVAEPAAASDEDTYTVQSGDTLWKISQEAYGDGSKYMKIFEANTGILKNPDQIYPGQKLVIPKEDD